MFGNSMLRNHEEEEEEPGKLHQRQKGSSLKCGITLRSRLKRPHFATSSPIKFSLLQQIESGFIEPVSMFLKYEHEFV